MKRLSFARRGLATLTLAWLALAAAAEAQEKTAAATRQYNTAVGLHNSDAWELAAKQWEKFIEDFPADPRLSRALYYLGICSEKLGRRDDAVQTWQRILKDDPDFELTEDTLLNLGLTQYNIAQGGKPNAYDEAAKTFDDLAGKFPQGKYIIEAVFYQGECLYNRGKKQEAVAKYSVVVNEHSDHKLAAQATFALGVAQADLNQHAEALKSFGSFLETFAADPLAGEVQMWQGESQYALKQYDQAVQSYSAAAQAAGFRLADYATMRQADALSAMQKFAEAAAIYESVPGKFPNSQYVGSCRLEAGKQYYRAGNFDKALENLNQVIAAAGDSAPEAAHWAARSALKQNKPADALKIIEQVLPGAAEGPMKVSLLMDQADAVYEIPDRRGESVALYAGLATAHAAAPEAPQALYMAAFVAMGQGDHQTALQHAQAFCQTHSDHALTVGAMHIVAESGLLLGKYAEAEKLYGELLAKAPQDQDAETWKVHLGTALYLQKKYQETIDALQPMAGQVKDQNLRAEAWYRIGRSQAALRQFEPCIQTLEASLEAAPKWKLADDAHLILAYACQQTKNFDKLKQNAQTVIDAFPESRLLDMAHYRLAEGARLSNDLKTAVSHYEVILKNWPETRLLKQTLYGLGWAQLGLQEQAAAEKAFSQLIEKFPDDSLIARARYGRGTARRQLKQFEPAIADLEAFLASDPPLSEKSRARHILGLCQRGADKHADAAATFSQLLQEDAPYADADSVYFELGWALKSQDKQKEAAEAFGKLVEKYPESSLAVDSHYLIGDYHYEQKNYQDAAKAYYTAMNQAGKTKLGEEAAYKLGLAYYGQDEIQKARQTFNYLRVTWPEGGALYSDAAFMEAECSFKEKDYQAALDAYEAIKSPSNQQVEELTLLHSSDAAAQLQLWQKSVDLAGSFIEKYAESPYLSRAMYLKGWALHNLNQSDEALKVFQEVAERFNDESAARSLFMIGEIDFQQKKYSEAIVSFIKVQSSFPFPKIQADATYEAARCFEMLRQIPQALKQYQRLLEKFPDSDKAALATERIAALKKT